jgi:hypothetical protein
MRRTDQQGVAATTPADYRLAPTVAAPLVVLAAVTSHPRHLHEVAAQFRCRGRLTAERADPPTDVPTP